MEHTHIRDTFSSSAIRPFWPQIDWYDWKKSAEHGVQQMFSTVQQFQGGDVGVSLTIPLPALATVNPLRMSGLPPLRLLAPGVSC
jgi:hypothetical protein